MSINIDVGSTNYDLLSLLGNFNEQFAWARFLEIYSPMIRNCCRSRGLNSHEVEEIQSMVSARLLTFFSSSESRVHTCFRGFLAKVVENEIRSFLRKEASERLIYFDTLPEDLTPFHLSQTQRDELDLIETDLTERIRLVSHVMSYVHLRVSEKTWKIYWDYAMIGRDVDEVAACYSVSKAAVFKSNQRVAQLIKDVSKSFCEINQVHG